MWRGFSQRRAVEAMRAEELVFLGMVYTCPTAFLLSSSVFGCFEYCIMHCIGTACCQISEAHGSLPGQEDWGESTVQSVCYSRDVRSGTSLLLDVSYVCTYVSRRRGMELKNSMRRSILRYSMYEYTTSICTWSGCNSFIRPLLISKGAYQIWLTACV